MIECQFEITGIRDHDEKNVYTHTAHGILLFTIDSALCRQSPFPVAQTLLLHTYIVT